MSVMILEKKHFSGGATGRNGGHLWPDTTTVSEEEIKTYGKEQAKKRYEFPFETIKLMQQVFQEHNIQCDLRFTGALDCARVDTEVKIFQENIASLQALDFIKSTTPTELWNEEQCKQALHTTEYKAAQYQECAAQFWPFKIVLSLVQVLIQQNTLLYTDTEVQSVQRQENELLLVKTSRGNVIAKHLVYATNAYTCELLPELKPYLQPVRGQCIATNPVKTRIDYSVAQNDGYEYLIQREDGRIIVGGMRWKSPTYEEGTYDDSVVNLVISQALYDYILKTFPSLQKEEVKIDYQWTGIMGYTTDRNPLIGPHPLKPNEWLAVGYTGNGLNFFFKRNCF